MSAFVITAPGAIRNPLPDTPYLPDISSDLLWEIDPARLVQDVANNAAISSIVADGPDALTNRTYNFAYPGWGFPTLSHAGGPGGAPAIMFDGTQQIANNAGTVGISQPLTYAFMVRSTAFASSQSRVLSSGSLIVAPGNSGYYASNTAASRLESGSSTTAWVPLVVVFDGAESKIKVGDGPIAVGPTGTATSGRNILGGNGTTLSGMGLNGGIALARCYARRFSDGDIEALASYMADRFD